MEPGYLMPLSRCVSRKDTEQHIRIDPVAIIAKRRFVPSARPTARKQSNDNAYTSQSGSKKHAVKNWRRKHRNHTKHTMGCFLERRQPRKATAKKNTTAW
jgi:hypothetical protein